jgi:hypothetical protein
MTVDELVVRGAMTAAASSAAAAAFARRARAPLAIALGAALLIDAARTGARAVATLALTDARAAVALALARVLYLAFPALSAWLALRSLAGVRAGARIVIAWAIASSFLVAWGPPRGPAVELFFLTMHELALCAEIAAVTVWARHARIRANELAILLLIAGDAAEHVGPWLSPSLAAERWTIARAQWTIVYLAVAIACVIDRRTIARRLCSD